MKGQHTYQQAVITGDHVTAHLCVSGDGRFLPTLIIFKESLLHRPFKDGVPGTWNFAMSTEGYMDKELFFSWFCKIFVPNCGRQRPVKLLMDNHSSHISLPVVEKAREENIVLLGLPSHTTHIAAVGCEHHRTIKRQVFHAGYETRICKSPTGHWES